MSENILCRTKHRRMKETIALHKAEVMSDLQTLQKGVLSIDIEKKSAIWSLPLFIINLSIRKEGRFFVKQTRNNLDFFFCFQT